MATWQDTLIIYLFHRHAKYYYTTHRHDNNTTTTTSVRQGASSTRLRDSATLRVRVQSPQTLTKAKFWCVRESFLMLHGIF